MASRFRQPSEANRPCGAGALAYDHLDPLSVAVDTFGFHLAVMDVRQNSKVHEEVLAELLARAHGEGSNGNQALNRVYDRLSSQEG